MEMEAGSQVRTGCGFLLTLEGHQALGDQMAAFQYLQRAYQNDRVKRLKDEGQH